jgi:hypothetical protein
MLIPRYARSLTLKQKLLLYNNVEKLPGKEDHKTGTSWSLLIFHEGYPDNRTVTVSDLTMKVPTNKGGTCTSARMSPILGYKD